MADRDFGSELRRNADRVTLEKQARIMPLISAYQELLEKLPTLLAQAVKEGKTKLNKSVNIPHWSGSKDPISDGSYLSDRAIEQILASHQTCIEMESHLCMQHNIKIKKTVRGWKESRSSSVSSYTPGHQTGYVDPRRFMSGARIKDLGYTLFISVTSKN